MQAKQIKLSNSLSSQLCSTLTKVSDKGRGESAADLLKAGEDIPCLFTRKDLCPFVRAEAGRNFLLAVLLLKQNRTRDFFVFCPMRNGSRLGKLTIRMRISSVARNAAVIHDHPLF